MPASEALAFDTSTVLTRVRRDSFLARSDDNWSDQNILAIANDCLISQFAPYMKTIKQNWFGTDVAIPFIANQSQYDFPEEAMWNSVNAILLQNIGGSEPGTIAGELSVVEPGTRALYEQFSTGTPAKFFMQDTQFVVMPTPDSTTVSAYQMLVPYYRRPAQMVLTTDCVQAKSTSGQVVVVTPNPPTGSLLSNALDSFASSSLYKYYVDIYSRTAPYTRKFANLLCSLATSGPNFVCAFNIGQITDAQVGTILPGDFITAHGTTPFPDLPPEGHPALCKMICATIDLAQKDSEALGLRVEAILKEFGAAVRGLSNRQDGSPRKMSLYFSSAARVIASTRQRWRGE